MKLQSSARRLISLFVIIVGVALQLGACSSKQSEMLGKWESADKSETMEFFEDKTLVYKWIPEPSTEASGKWVVLSDARIKIDLLALGVLPLPPAMGSLKGEELVLEGGLWDKARAGTVLRKSKK